MAVLANVLAEAAAETAKAGKGSLRFRGSLGGRSGMTVPCGSGWGKKIKIFGGKIQISNPGY